MSNIIKRVWNQNKMVNIESLHGMAFQAEDGGHVFEISGVNDAGEAVPLSGTVAGVFMRPDRADIALIGAASGGVASVTLTDDCYAVPGRFGLTIFVTEDGKKTAVYAAVGTVSRTSGGGVAGDTPQDVVDLINAIEAAVATIPADYTDLIAAVAPTYSSSSVYAVGAYAWYGGILYRCTTPITTAESWTAAHWKSVVIGDDVATISASLPRSYDSIENELEQITGNRGLVFQSGVYVTTSATGIGQTVSHTESKDYVCAISPCVEGDQFYVNVRGGTGTTRAYFFCDSNMVCTRRSNANELVNYRITARAGEAFVVFSNKLTALSSGFYAYKGVSLLSTFNDSENASIRYRKQLSSADDLDQLFDIGVYVAISSSMPTNSPTVIPFVLSIFGSPIGGSGDSKTAFLINQNGSALVRSTVSGGAWGNWVQLAKQEDTSYLKSGLLSYTNGILPIENNLVKGSRRANGNIDPAGVGICTKELYYLNTDTIITANVKDGWVYTVMEGYSPTSLQETHRQVYDPIIITKKPYIGFTFYKTAGGSVVNTELSDYTGQITLDFRLTSQSDLVHDVPENAGVANLIKRAYQMTNISYDALKDIPFYGSRVMAEGSFRNGIPYSSVRPENLYVPQSVSFDAFMTALMNPNSYIYTKELDIPNYYGHTYYGSVCSAFVAWCYQIEDVIPTTISFSHYDGFDELPSDQQNWRYIKLGDMLNKPGSHIVIVTDILRNRYGEIAYIELSEETDAVSAVARSKIYTRDKIQELYNQGYRIYRYANISSIEYEPSPWVHVEPFETAQPTYNSNIISRRGNNVNYPAGDPVVIDIIEQGSYTGYSLTNIGTSSTTTGTISGATITLSSLSAGKYKLCLTGDGNSDYIYFDVISTVGTKYETQSGRKVKVTPSTTLGTMSSVLFCGSNPGEDAFLAVVDFHVFTDAEIAQGYAIVDAPTADADNAPSDVWYMRCMYKTDFGLYSGSFSSVPVSTPNQTVTEAAYQESQYIVPYPAS